MHFLSVPSITKKIIALLFLLASGGFLVWVETTKAAAQNPQAADPKAIEAGKQHYEAHCAACHGADAKGGERGPDIISTGSARRRSAEELAEVIRKGRPAAGMPAFQLPERELQELIAFLRSLSAPAFESAVAGDLAAAHEANIIHRDIKLEISDQHSYNRAAV